MPDVFISYSRQDLESVSRLANAITDAGYEVWWDAELPPHKSYSDVIEEKVETSKAAVVVWSPTARQSQWVRAEAEMAAFEESVPGDGASPPDEGPTPDDSASEDRAPAPE